MSRPSGCGLISESPLAARPIGWADRLFAGTREETARRCSRTGGSDYRCSRRVPVWRLLFGPDYFFRLASRERQGVNEASAQLGVGDTECQDAARGDCQIAQHPVRRYLVDLARFAGRGLVLDDLSDIGRLVASGDQEPGATRLENGERKRYVASCN